MHKIVARFKNGRVLKGNTQNFNPSTPNFHFVPLDAEVGAKPEIVELRDLKAVFFVRTFEGDPKREDREFFLPNQPYQGREVQVEFIDGEILIGSTPNYTPEMPGFFIFPADVESNTIKVFAVTSGIKHVTFRPPGKK